MIEMPRYLPWLVGQLRRFGVEIIARRVDSLEPALAEAEVVINATGLGARELVGDERVYPLRGQTVLVERRPGLDRALLEPPDDDDADAVAEDADPEDADPEDKDAP